MKERGVCAKHVEWMTRGSADMDGGGGGGQSVDQGVEMRVTML